MICNRISVCCIVRWPDQRVASRGRISRCFLVTFSSVAAGIHGFLWDVLNRQAGVVGYLLKEVLRLAEGRESPALKLVCVRQAFLHTHQAPASHAELRKEAFLELLFSHTFIIDIIAAKDTDGTICGKP